MSQTDDLLRVLRSARQLIIDYIDACPDYHEDSDYIDACPDYYEDGDDLVLRDLDEQIMRLERLEVVSHVAG